MQLFPWFTLAVDFFLVIVVFNALDGSTLAGMTGGCAAGLLTDALTGGPFGLFGIANTVVGYGTATAAQRLVIQRASSSLLVFCLAAAAQQAVVLALALLLLPSPGAPDVRWIAVKVATSGVLGLALYLGRGRFTSRMEVWRRTRTSKVRFGR
jgi:rod shape-determining protein MreD